MLLIGVRVPCITPSLRNVEPCVLRLANLYSPSVDVSATGEPLCPAPEEGGGGQPGVHLSMSKRLESASTTLSRRIHYRCCGHRDRALPCTAIRGWGWQAGNLVEGYPSEPSCINILVISVVSSRTNETASGFSTWSMCGESE